MEVTKKIDIVPAFKGLHNFVVVFIFNFYCCCYYLNVDYISLEVEFIDGIIFAVGERKNLFLYPLGLAARACKLN